jgi:hypothetical protein
MPVDLATFRRRLAETIAWCAPRGSPTDPQDSLRTPALRPAGWHEEAYGKLTDVPGGPQATVDMLVAARGRLLRAEPAHPTARCADLAGGRLLAYDPDANLFDGFVEAETRGFYDVDNIPPWDTWLCYTRERDSSLGWQYWDAYLVSWVPPQCVPLAQQGIDLIAEDCIAWLDSLDTMLRAQLAEEGLIS